MLIPAGAAVEKRHQRLYVRRVSANVKRVQFHRTKEPLALLLLLPRKFGIRNSDRRVERIQQHTLAGFRVFRLNHAHRRKFALARVAHRDRNHVMLAARHAQRLLIAAILKIGDEKHDRFARRDAVQILQRRPQIRSALFRRQIQQIPNDAQHVILPFFRRNVRFDVVREGDQADFVVIFDRGKRQDRAEFDGALGFHLIDRAERAGRAQIYDENDRQFALFDVQLDERMPGASGDVPINQPRLHRQFLNPYRMLPALYVLALLI